MNENEMNRTADLPGADADAAASGEAAPRSEFYQAPVSNPGKRPNAPIRRRTGTLTLGLALILVGGCILGYCFVPGFDLFAAAKLSPLLLVLMGLEILIGSFLKGDEYRVNFGSVLLCLILVGCSLCVAVIPMFWDYYGPESEQREAQITSELSSTCYDQLKNSGVTYLDSHLNRYTQAEHLNELTAADDLRVNVDLRGEYADAAAFARACQPVLSVLTQTIPSAAHQSVYLEGTNTLDGQPDYSVSLSGLYQMTADLDTLTSLVTASDSEEADALAQWEQELTDRQASLEEWENRLANDSESTDDEALQAASLRKAYEAVQQLVDSGLLDDEKAETARRYLYETYGELPEA